MNPSHGPGCNRGGARGERRETRGKGQEVMSPSVRLGGRKSLDHQEAGGTRRKTWEYEAGGSGRVLPGFF